MKKEPALFTSLQKASMDKGRSKFFLFFLLFSFILWFIAKFSKEYTEIVLLEMELKNVPETIILADQNPIKVEFTLKATGFQFLYYQLLANRLSISVQEANFKEDRASLPIAAQFQNLQEQFLGKTEIINYFPGVIEFDYQVQSTKKVKVIPPQMKLAVGYALTSIQFEPDSILIIGPKNLIQEIKQIQPLYESKAPIKDSFETFLNISSEDKYTNLSANTVFMKVNVDRFTEAKYQLPIEIINVPGEGVFKFFPSKVSITFSAPLNILSSISANDFQIGVDFKQLSNNNKSVKLSLFKSPKGISNIRLEPKVVQYLMRQ